MTQLEKTMTQSGDQGDADPRPSLMSMISDINTLLYRHSPYTYDGSWLPDCNVVCHDSHYFAETDNSTLFTVNSHSLSPWGWPSGRCSTDSHSWVS